MTLEEAILTAIEYETKVRDAYLGSVASIKEQAGQTVFEVLGKEEQGHIDFLKACLVEWKKTGKLSTAALDTIVPAKERLAEGMAKLDDHLSTRDYGTERELLRKALALEEETSNFYRKMVDEMVDSKAMFARFLEIEEGHKAIVQAELDYLNKTGHFFDFQEFNLEH